MYQSNRKLMTIPQSLIDLSSAARLIFVESKLLKANVVETKLVWVVKACYTEAIHSTIIAQLVESRGV